MRRVNVRLILLLLVSVVGGLAGVYFLHRHQVVRNAHSILAQARERVAEDRVDLAAGLYMRYVGLRPDDAEAQAELAKLLLKRAQAPTATRRDVLAAFEALEAAVRKSPDSDDMREKLGSFLLRIGNATNAKQHFAAIREGRLRGPQQGEQDFAQAERPAELSDEAIELRYAQACAGSGNYDEASQVASKLIGFDIGTKAFDPAWEPLPNCIEAYVLVAELLERRFKDPDSAARVMRRLPEAYPKEYMAWLAMARWSYTHGDPGAAGIEVAKAAELAPDKPEVLFADFEISLQAGNYDRAQRIIRERMTEFADDPRVIIGRADISLALGDTPAALETLLEGAEKIRDNPLILGRLIEVLYDQERLDEIPARIERLRQVEGEDAPSVMWAEARLCMSRGQWNKAVELLRQMRPLVAASQTLVNNADLALAICHQYLGQPDELMEAARRVLSDDPNSYQGRIALATAHSLAGRNDEALAEFESLAAVQSPEQLGAKQLLWAPLLDLRIKEQVARPAGERDWTKVDALVDILAQNPLVTDDLLANVRSNVLRWKGETTEAIGNAARALETSPDSPAITAQYVNLLLSAGRVEEARKVIETRSPETRLHPLVLSAEALVAASEGDERSAAGLQAVESAATKLDPRDAVPVLLSLLRIRIEQKRFDEGERLAKVILDMEPGELRTHSVLLDLAAAQRDVEKLATYAEMIGSVAGSVSPQARVAQAMVILLKVRLKREKMMGSDTVPPPLDADDLSNLETARSLLVEAENDRPGWYQIQQGFSEIEGLRGDNDAAISHLQRAVDQGGVGPERRKLLVGLLHQAGRFDEARDLIKGLGEEAGFAGERIAADIDAKEGRAAAAVARAERITRDAEPSADNQLWLARLLEACQRDDAVIGALERATELAPDRVDCWLELIRQQLRLGQSKAAEESLTRATRALEGVDRAWVEAATAEMLGQQETAERAYRAATEAAPADPRVARLLAEYLIRRGMIVPARQEMRRIIDMPEAAGTTSLYWARRSLLRHTSAGTDWKDLMELCELVALNVDPQGNLTPDDARVEFAVLMERDEPEAWRRAVAIIDDLGRRQRLDADQRVLRAWLLDKLGNWTEAREALVDIAADEDCSPLIIATLVEQLLEHGEVISARTWASRLRDRAPDAPMTLRSEAQLAIAANDREAAADSARKLIPDGPLTPENAPSLLSTAELVEKLGFPKAAEKLLTECADVIPEGTVALARFLGRQQRTDEAMAKLETSWGLVPAVTILDAGIDILSKNGANPSSDADARLIRLVDRARRDDPDSMLLGLIDAVVRETVGDTGAAEALYRELLGNPAATAPIAARVANNLAKLLVDSGRVDEATTLVEKSMEQLGPHPNVLDTRALVWLAKGDTTRAIADLQESLLDPSAIKYLHMAAACFEARQISDCRAALVAAEGRGLRQERLAAAERERLASVDKSLGEFAIDAAVPSVRDRLTSGQ